MYLKMKVCHIVICLFWLLNLTTSKLVQVPPISSDQQISLRLSQLIEVDSSFKTFGNLSTIYKKQALQIVNEQETAFPVCYEDPPETKFLGRATRSITDMVDRHGLIYDFSQIKYPRSLIDIAVYNLKVYYMLENGKLQIDKLTEDYRQILHYKQQQSQQTKVAQGSIVIMPNAHNSSDFGIFINQNQALLFNIQTDQFYQINNYQTVSNFTSATYLQAGYFAVAYGGGGIKIFSVNFIDYTLNLQASIGQQFNYADLAYDGTRKILFLVDEKVGVSSLQINYQNVGLSTKLTSSSIKINNCNLIYYDSYQDELYLSCNYIHKYRISNWPMIEEKVLPRQDITVRQITTTDKLVAFIGRDIFEVIFAGRRTAIYENRLLDKLILMDKYFLSANEYQILLGTYLLLPPAIFCTTSDTKTVGSHRVVLRVTANCNQEYFSKVGFNVGEIGSEDRCIYSVYQNLKIWEPANIDTTPFLVIAIMILILSLGILVWWIYSFVDLRKLRKSLGDYENLQEENRGTTGDNEKDNQYNVEDEIEEKKVNTNEKLKQSKVPDEIEMPESNLHDIE